MNIFLALNNPELQTLTAKLLRIGGHNPCESTKTTLTEAIRSSWIDFLLADLNLEPLGAEELVAPARVKLPRLPILLLSGGELDESAKRRVAAMRVEFLQRPHTPVVLMAAINRTKLLSSTVTIGKFWEMMALSERIFFKNYDPDIPENTERREDFLREFQIRLEKIKNEMRCDGEDITGDEISNECVSLNDIFSPGIMLKGKIRQLLVDLIFWLECQKKKL